MYQFFIKRPIVAIVIAILMVLVGLVSMLGVRVGSLVRVRDGELEEWWRIVPSHEADAMRRCISEETPFARALLGHQVGDEVRTQAPGGRWTVTILGVDSEGVWG